MAMMCAAAACAAQSPRKKESETRYLAFQVFTGSADPVIAIGDSGMQPLSAIPAELELAAFIEDLVHRIGTVGGGSHRLAVIFGPLAFDHTDAETRQLIDEAFSLALRYHVAIGFHIDDSMFWARRSDLWKRPENVEWVGWDGAAGTGRRIDWGPQPKKLPPQMCFNSPAILHEVRARAAVIGRAIQAGRDRLVRQHQEALFAGVIAGWETQIGQDFDTRRPEGYHALFNRGFRKDRLPANPDTEREAVVRDFIDLWCRSLAEASVPADRIYSHTAFLSRRVFDANSSHTETYAEHNHFALTSTAFGADHRPGFSTYPQPGLFEQLYTEVNRHGRAAWASSEGTNLQLGSGPGQSGMNMETYLGRMFNHGAALVNLFSWGIGGEANRQNPFRVVTEGEEALNAYRKFLRGERLQETLQPTNSYLERLPAKIHRIQSELPVWIQKTGRQAEVEPLMHQLDAALKAGDFTAAEKAADEILALLGRHG